jgi:cytosine deaminase
MRGDADIAGCFDLVTTAPARVLGLDANYGLVIGAWADLVVLNATSVPEAVVGRPRDRLVIKRGVMLHEGLDKVDGLR